MKPFILSLLLTLPAAALAQQYSWTNFVGQPGGAGNADGTGSDARFDNPSGVAVDTSGNIYVSDQRNYSIRKVTSTGTVTTLAGSGSSGSADGTGSAASFGRPESVAVDVSGNIYVADSSNCTIRKVTATGVVTTLAGSAGSPGSADGTGSSARFNQPGGIAVDGSGNIYVADTLNYTIRKVTAGGVVTTLAGLAGNIGSADGTGSGARFHRSYGLAVDGSGNIYVADSINDTVRKVTPAGVVTTLAGLAGSSGSANGTGSAARFNRPYGVTVDAGGNVYVADTANHTLRKVTPAGVVTTLVGLVGTSGSADGTGSAARFFSPIEVTVDGSGTLYVADSGNHAIRKVTAAGVVTTLAGTAESVGSTNGTGSAARFDFPMGVALDASGNAYVSDYGNHTLRKVSTAGAVTTLAGLAGSFGSANGTGSAARFDFPAGAAVDASGTVYVADSGNHTIRKVTAAGAVTTLAGFAGTSGSANGTGSAARFNEPRGVAVDSSGNVYVADRLNHTIRKVTSGGVVTTLAGLAGTTGFDDGTGSAARFGGPSGVAVDSSGNVYVTDSGNYTIRKVTAAGVVTTLAGSATFSGTADGTGSAAQFGYLDGIALDSSGTLYVTEFYEHTIRKVTAAGVVTTIGGTPGVEGGSDGQGPAALFTSPTGIAARSTGMLYVADSDNNRITTGTPPPVLVLEQPVGASIASGGTQSFTAVQGSSASLTFTIRNTGGSNLTGLTITKDGPNAADFSVTSNPTAPVAVGGTTTFVIQFNANQTSTETAAIHIASNDTTNNPFNLNLTGLILYNQGQYNANRTAGQNDVTTAPNTYNLYSLSQYNTNRTAGQDDVINSPNTYSLYTLSQVQALNVGTPLIQRNGAGQFTLTIGVEKATDLINFNPFPMTSPQAIINGAGKLEFQFSVPDNAAFFQLRAQ